MRVQLDVSRPSLKARISIGRSRPPDQTSAAVIASISDVGPPAARAASRASSACGLASRGPIVTWWSKVTSVARSCGVSSPMSVPAAWRSRSSRAPLTLPLTSSATATSIGCAGQGADGMVCATPLSVTVKSPAASPATGRRRSTTSASMRTTSTLARNCGAAAATASDAASRARITARPRRSPAARRCPTAGARPGRRCIPSRDRSARARPGRGRDARRRVRPAPPR